MRHLLRSLLAPASLKRPAPALPDYLSSHILRVLHQLPLVASPVSAPHAN